MKYDLRQYKMSTDENHGNGSLNIYNAPGATFHQGWFEGLLALLPEGPFEDAQASQLRAEGRSRNRHRKDHYGNNKAQDLENTSFHHPVSRKSDGPPASPSPGSNCTTLR